MFSFLMKNIRKRKTPLDVTNLDLAEDALETDLANPNTDSMKCVASESYFLDSKKQPIRITLVQGSSDSKPKSPAPSKNHEFEQIISSRKDSHVNITPKRSTASVQLVHKASPHTSASRLYPNLDLTNTSGSSSSAIPKFIKVKECKSIHDIAKEICLMIEPRILYATTIEKEVKRLKSETQKYILIIYDMIKKSSKFEYNFTTELDLRKNYSYVKVYEKLHSFDDVQKCHKRAKEPTRRKIARNRNSDLVFQSYHTGLRCYKGQKLDIIDCD